MQWMFRYLAVLVSLILQLCNKVVHPSLPVSHLKHLGMDDTISNLLGRQIDPGDLLSNEDLVKMIMNDTNTKVNDLWKDIREELKLDRDHNREVIKNVVDGFCKRLDNLEKFVLDNASKHSNLIADIELKQETISSYQEQLTCNLGKKVHDLCDKLKNHEKSCH